MTKRWQKDQISYLKQHARTKRLAELAKRFRTDEAAIRDKLVELGLRTKDAAGSGQDPAVKYLEDALMALGAKKWSTAEKLLEKALQESDQIDLAGRARVYLEICRQEKAKKHSGEEDPYLEAVLAKNRGELESALTMCTRGGRRQKDERFAYLAASIHALQGELEEAARLLGIAIELNPKNRIHAYHDPDFAALRKQRFPQIFAGS